MNLSIGPNINILHAWYIVPRLSSYKPHATIYSGT